MLGNIGARAVTASNKTENLALCMVFGGDKSEEISEHGFNIYGEYPRCGIVGE
jgi:hypothetical protein